MTAENAVFILDDSERLRILPTDRLISVWRKAVQFIKSPLTLYGEDIRT
jgi:hypothetical protein